LDSQLRYKLWQLSHYSVVEDGEHAVTDSIEGWYSVKLWEIVLRCVGAGVQSGNVWSVLSKSYSFFYYASSFGIFISFYS